jgi:hypothetical protein
MNSEKETLPGDQGQPLVKERNLRLRIGFRSAYAKREQTGSGAELPGARGGRVGLPGVQSGYEKRSIAAGLPGTSAPIIAGAVTPHDRRGVDEVRKRSA